MIIRSQRMPVHITSRYKLPSWLLPSPGRRLSGAPSNIVDTLAAEAEGTGTFQAFSALIGTSFRFSARFWRPAPSFSSSLAPRGACARWSGVGWGDVSQRGACYSWETQSNGSAMITPWIISLGNPLFCTRHDTQDICATS